MSSPSPERSRFVRLVALVVTTTVVLSACGNDSGDGDDEESTEAVEVELDVPDGALPEGVSRSDITATRSDDGDEIPDLGEDVVPLATFDLRPDGTEFNEPIEATVTVPFEAGAVIVARLDSGGESEDLTPVSQSTTDDLESIVATFEISHFSRLRLGVQHASMELTEPEGVKAEVISEDAGHDRPKVLVLRVPVGVHEVGTKFPVTFRVFEPVQEPVTDLTVTSLWYGGAADIDLQPDSGDLLADLAKGFAPAQEAIAGSPTDGGGSPTDGGGSPTDGGDSPTDGDGGSEPPASDEALPSPVRPVAGEGTPGQIGASGEGPGIPLIGTLAFNTDGVVIPQGGAVATLDSVDITRVLECVRPGGFEVSVLVTVAEAPERETNLLARVFGQCVEASRDGSSQSGTGGASGTPATPAAADATGDVTDCEDGSALDYPAGDIAGASLAGGRVIIHLTQSADEVFDPDSTFSVAFFLVLVDENGDAIHVVLVELHDGEETTTLIDPETGEPIDGEVDVKREGTAISVAVDGEILDDAASVEIQGLNTPREGDPKGCDEFEAGIDELRRPSGED